MELSFHDLKQKEVISVGDGKNLGKVCDISISFPECNWLGMTVSGSKGFKFTNKREEFIPVNQIVKIGEDAILVKPYEKPSPCPPPNDKCPPPPCPPQRPDNRPNFPNNIPDRRDYGEYE